eukprot:CAMPEP_0178450018 /NCGR_PEP_ID=MMETSP0689_2-20121128/42881_1 /TAXON_ID=160604 /ORGANISM="Amphidinium massartii, Strain CS-259" /LENGTH=232 /DNA_ID=CAMNT_0020075417 /DNA_START=61 /DNA_END=756 /DNA_ORIENTATION=-
MTSAQPRSLAPGQPFSLALQKPLGIVLEERDFGGVVVESLEGGSGKASGLIEVWDVVLAVGSEDVASADLDTVFEIMRKYSTHIQLTLVRSPFRHLQTNAAVMARHTEESEQQLCDRAEAAKAEGDDEKARELFTAALCRNPNFEPAINGLAVALMANRIYALSSLAYAALISPTYFCTFNTFGTLFWELGDPARAAQMFEQAMRLDAKAHGCRGNHLLVLNYLEGTTDAVY